MLWNKVASISNSALLRISEWPRVCSEPYNYFHLVLYYILNRMRFKSLRIGYKSKYIGTSNFLHSVFFASNFFKSHWLMPCKWLKISKYAFILRRLVFHKSLIFLPLFSHQNSKQIRSWNKELSGCPSLLSENVVVTVSSFFFFFLTVVRYISHKIYHGNHSGSAVQ